MIFAHYNNVNNIGDRVCCPKYYFPEWLKHPFNFLYYENNPIVLSEGIIVIGGGGVMVSESQWFYDFLSQLHRPCVVWGAGTNGMESDPFWMPMQMDQFTMVGIRDFNCGWPYVPCPSCLHPAFNLKGQPRHEFIIYDSVTMPIEIDAPIRLNTSHPWMEDIVNAMLSTRTVITNSYHGAYWAMLLNRRVLLMPNDTNRFKFLKHQPPRCDMSNWKEQVAGDPTAPADFLDECRSLNLDFAAKVRELEIQKS